MEVVQLEHVVRVAGPVAVRRRPCRRAEDHAQGAGPSARVRRTAAAVIAEATAQEQPANEALQVLVQPVANSRVRPVQPVDAAVEKPLSANKTVQLAVVVFPAQQHFEERVISLFVLARSRKFRLFILFFPKPSSKFVIFVFDRQSFLC